MIVPLFALANAGIHLDGQLLGDAVTSPITLGILFGYVVGKPLGIIGAARGWRRGSAGLRLALSWPTIVGGGADRRHRLHGLAADREPSPSRGSSSRRRSSACFGAAIVSALLALASSG